MLFALNLLKAQLMMTPWIGLTNELSQADLVKMKPELGLKAWPD